MDYWGFASCWVLAIIFDSFVLDDMEFGNRGMEAFWESRKQSMIPKDLLYEKSRI